jgi:hypothetical protein
MADADDIKKSQEALNEYNESLRDSISLTRVLSDAIQSMAKRLGGVNAEDRKLIDTTKDLNKALSNTLGLTDKLYSGKLKQKDVDLQLNKLQETRRRLEAEALDANSRISQAKIKQINLSAEINKGTQTQLELEGESESLYTRRNDLVAELKGAINRENQARAAGNSAGIALAESEQKVLNEQLKVLNYEVAEQTRIILNQEKILSKTKQQKEEADKIVGSYNDLVKLIDKEIIENKALNDILNEQIKKTKEQTTLGKLQSKNFQTFVSGLKEAGVLLTPLVAAFNAIKKFAFNISDQVTKLQKNLVLSRDEAYEVRQEFNNIAVASEDIAINTNRLLEANAQLGKQLGFNSKFTKDLNIQFVKLTKQIGLSEEAAGGLAKLSIATGKTLEESKNIALETSQRLSSQYGIQLNQREVLEEIGKISGQTLAMLKASPQAIAQAVAQAKLLGTNLDTVRKQASSLLDFETSISNELQAELLTGQLLNLERARSAALVGDLTTAMKELNNQNIDFNKFSQMNVIAQDKVAAALGLSSDELSDQLLKQQYMNKSREEIVALAGEEVANRIEALSAQDKFNLAVEKMQDLVGKLVGGNFGTFVDGVANLLDNSVVLYGIFATMAAISFTKLIAGLAASAVQAGLLAAGSATAMSALTFGVGAIAVTAAITGIAAAYEAFKGEATEFADGGVIYGKTNAIVGEYQGVENNPEVIAPLSDLQNIINNSKQTVVTQDNTEMISMLTSLRDEMRNTNKGVDRLYNKEAKVILGTQTIGTAQLMYRTDLA